MVPLNVLHKNFIKLRKNTDIPNIYDVELLHLDALDSYDSMECHFVIYPYSRKVCSNNIRFHPFEEYVKDILTQQKSAYVSSKSQFNKLFGILLGLLITIVFFRWKPSDLFSVESIVSVFGAYFVGKEIWDDIERNLVNVSRTWKIRYQEEYYAYQLEKHTTLTLYSRFAKKHRYGKTPLLPGKMDFIEQSNSQTLRMAFDAKDFRDFSACNGTCVGHLFSIHLDPELVDVFDQEGFLFGVKLSLNKQILGFTHRLELFQSLDHGMKGALDEKGHWNKEAIFFRKTLTFGRLKGFLKSGIIEQQTIVSQ